MTEPGFTSRCPLRRDVQTLLPDRQPCLSSIAVPRHAGRRGGMLGVLSRLCAGAGLAATVLTPAAAEPSRAGEVCEAIERRLVAEAGPKGPALLASYPDAGPGGPLPPAVDGAAHVYDNAVAVIALLSCGRTVAAGRIADALAYAASADRTFSDGRLRNAYRNGPVPLDKPWDLPGWWDEAAGAWHEDGYAVGSTTGNVAWAALGLLHMHRATGERRYVAAAARAMDWVLTNAAGPPRSPCFAGGFASHDADQQRLGWCSTEHNVDVAAAAAMLFESTGRPAFAAAARQAGAFVEAMRQRNGRILVGTGDDGLTPNRELLGIDAMIWPVLAGLVAPYDAGAVLAASEAAFGVAGGFDFNDDRDGLWVEGTAHASTAYRILGATGRADALIDGLLAHDVAPIGYLFATRAPSLTTGLFDGPDPIRYFRWPHLGATAWVVLATLGVSPFTLPPKAR